MLTSEEIKVLVNSGEGYNVDFKLKVPSKVRELSEEVCAFANAAGGYLLISFGLIPRPLAAYFVFAFWG